MISEAMLKRLREINADLEIRTAQPEDALQFIQLMNSYYNRKKDESYFDWQYINCVLPTRLFVVRQNGMMAGFYGVQIHSLNGKWPCGFIIDLLVAEQFRNRGVPFLLEEKAVQFALANNAVALALLPNANGIRAHLGIPGWKHVGTIKTMSLKCKKNDISNNLPSIRFNEKIAFTKTPEYREWRFNKNPIYSYKKCKINKDTFAVTKIFIDPLTGDKYGDIVDYECPDKSLKIIREIFVFACEDLIEQGVSEVTTWALPHSNLRAVIESIGFEESVQERYFGVKVLNHKFNKLYDFSKWDLVPADSEVF